MAASSATSSHRGILPISATSSLKTTASHASVFDPERALAKLEMRIADYFLNSLREIVLATRFKRGKTLHQGARAPHGSQAAHHSLIPNPQDLVLEMTVEKVFKSTFTPTKSLPFVKTRTGLGTPELIHLKENATNQDTFKTRLLEKMPQGSESSSVAGTSAYLFSNATIDNPIESNQLDSKLERTIAPMLCKLQEERAAGHIDAIQSTQQLILWMHGFYHETLSSCKAREEDLKNCQSILSSSSDFNAIIDILEKRLPSLPSIRIPAKVKKEITAEQLTTLIEKKLASLAQFQREADLFLKHLEQYDSPCTLLALQLALFGIVEENGERRQPTNEELRAAVFATLKPDPHYPIKRRRTITKAHFRTAPQSPSY